MKVLGLIPARFGSKGIPKKNIKPFNGEPLISYSIKNALDSNFITHTVVSTDSREIADIALDCGGIVLDCTLFSTTIPFLEFSIQFQSNNLIYNLN